jgi:Secretion system C-terminal sorting domain
LEARTEASSNNIISRSEWNAYPNPFVTNLHIKNNEFENGNVQITMYNQLSQKVAILSNYQNLEGNAFYENFDLSYLPGGIYTLIIEHNGKQSVSKVTKAE